MFHHRSAVGVGEEEETPHLMEPRKNVFVPDIFISQSSSGSREAQDDLSTVPGLQSSSFSSFSSSSLSLGVFQYSVSGKASPR